MNHGLMYSGGIEANLPTLRPGATTFVGSDGTEHKHHPWPPSVNGIKIYYMEKPGKHFLAVRVQDSKDDLLVMTPLLLDPSRHMGYGNRFAAEPTVINDEHAVTILGDILAHNPHLRDGLKAMRDRIVKS
jgi:hypothetical protein